MIDEVMWDPRSGQVTLTMSGHARVIRVETWAVDLTEVTTVTLPYSDARTLGEMLMRGLGIQPLTDEERDDEEIEDLHATIVRQATEITALKGERV